MKTKRETLQLVHQHLAMVVMLLRESAKDLEKIKSKSYRGVALQLYEDSFNLEAIVNMINLDY